MAFKLKGVEQKVEPTISWELTETPAGGFQLRGHREDLPEGTPGRMNVVLDFQKDGSVRAIALGEHFRAHLKVDSNNRVVLTPG